jgi:hypothetical protein
LLLSTRHPAGAEFQVMFFFVIQNALGEQLDSFLVGVKPESFVGSEFSPDFY